MTRRLFSHPPKVSRDSGFAAVPPGGSRVLYEVPEFAPSRGGAPWRTAAIPSGGSIVNASASTADVRLRGTLNEWVPCTADLTAVAGDNVLEFIFGSQFSSVPSVHPQLGPAFDMTDPGDPLPLPAYSGPWSYTLTLSPDGSLLLRHGLATLVWPSLASGPTWIQTLGALPAPAEVRSTSWRGDRIAILNDPGSGSSSSVRLLAPLSESLVADIPAGGIKSLSAGVRLSADGALVALSVFDVPQFRVWTTSSSPVEVTPSNPLGDQVYIAWGPDGDLYGMARVSNTLRIARWPRSGLSLGSPTVYMTGVPHFTQRSNTGTALTWHHAGRWVATIVTTSSARRPWRVQILDAHAGFAPVAARELPDWFAARSVVFWPGSNTLAVGGEPVFGASLDDADSSIYFADVDPSTGAISEYRPAPGRSKVTTSNFVLHPVAPVLIPTQQSVVTYLGTMLDAVSLVDTAVPSAELLVNGSFENVSGMTDQPHISCHVGQPPGWSVLDVFDALIDAYIKYAPVSGYSAYAGARFLMVSGFGSPPTTNVVGLRRLRQVVTGLTAGQSLRLSFAAALPVATRGGLTVTWNGVQVPISTPLAAPSTNVPLRRSVDLYRVAVPPAAAVRFPESLVLQPGTMVLAESDQAVSIAAGFVNTELL